MGETQHAIPKDAENFRAPEDGQKLKLVPPEKGTRVEKINELAKLGEATNYKRPEDEQDWEGLRRNMANVSDKIKIKRSIESISRGLNSRVLNERMQGQTGAHGGNESLSKLEANLNRETTPPKKDSSWKKIKKFLN